MLTINTNVSSLNAQRNLSRTQGNLSVDLKRLSSGMRINSAADDAAGLGISERMKADMRSFKQAERNAQDGMSMLQTAESGMSEVSSILVRMKELATQSRSETLGTKERKLINNEFTELKSEIDRIANVTEFNGKKLLDGSSSSGVAFQVGIGNTSNDRITASISDMNAVALGSSSTASVGSASVSTAAAAGTAIGVINDALDDVSLARSTLGAKQNRLNVTIANLQAAHESTAAANSRIRDVDIASQSASMTSNTILIQAGASVLAQSNSLLPQVALGLIG